MSGLKVLKVNGMPVEGASSPVEVPMEGGITEEEKNRLVYSYEEQIRELMERNAQERKELEEQENLIEEQRKQLEEFQEVLAAREASMNETNHEISGLREELRAVIAEKEKAETDLKNIIEGKKEELSGELLKEQEELDICKHSIEELQREKGEAFAELMELSRRYEKDLRYIAYNDKNEFDKIDGLEIFRLELHKLQEKMEELLTNGLERAYVFQGTALYEKFEEHFQECTGALEKMFSMIEEYDETPEENTEEVKVDGRMSSEQSVEKSRECVKKIEETLKQMHELIEKVLLVKNTIKFDFQG